MQKSLFPLSFLFSPHLYPFCPTRANQNKVKISALFQKWLVFTILLIVNYLPTAHSQWTVETLPNQHAQFTATTLGNKVFFGPGSSFTGFQTYVDIYNVQSGEWEETLEVSVPRCNAASVTANSKVYFAGGLANTWFNPVMVDVVDIYDTLTGEWTSAQLSVARSELKAVHVGDKLLFSGGITDVSVTAPYSVITSDIVDIYDLSSGEWSTANLSQPRVGIAAATWGDIAVFAGGQISSGEVTNAVDIFDAATGSWSSLELSEAKGWCESAALNGKIYIAGGVTGDLEVTDKVDILDLTTMTWTSAQLSEPRGGMRSGVLGNKIFFAGGGKYNLTEYHWVVGFSNQVDIYDDTDGAWSADNILIGRINHAAAVAGNKFMVAGGAPQFSHVEIYTDPFFTTTQVVKREVIVLLYPNPTSDLLQVNIEADEPSTFQIQLFDLTGKMLATRDMNSGGTSFLNMADLTKGTYLVKAIDRARGVVVKRIVKL